MNAKSQNERHVAELLSDEAQLEATFGDPLPEDPVPFHERLGLQKSGTTPITIRIDQGDLEKAKKWAASHQMGYQTLLKAIIHEGLGKLA